MTTVNVSELCLAFCDLFHSQSSVEALIVKRKKSLFVNEGITRTILRVENISNSATVYSRSVGCYQRSQTCTEFARGLDFPSVSCFHTQADKLATFDACG